jgi:hypothetical protein
MATGAVQALRLLRVLGVGVVLATAAFLALYGLRLAGSAGADLGARRWAIVPALLLAALASLAMAADLADLWLRGRRFSEFSVRMTRSFVFVSLLLSFGLSLLFQGPSVFVLLGPALVVYLLGTWKRGRPGTTRAGAAGRGRDAGSRRGAGQARQRRGGRKRR